MLLLICNRELLFTGKRKDEDDMAKSTKTYEERIRALEKKEQESIEATKKLIAQRKELEKRKKAEESKKRTHRLCQIGGAVESVLGCPIEEEDLPKLIGFLKRQETNGKFFSKAMHLQALTGIVFPAAHRAGEHRAAAEGFGEGIRCLAVGRKAAADHILAVIH